MFLILDKPFLFTRGAFLKAILYFLNGVRKSIPPESSTFLSTNQFSSVNTGIEIAISMMIPCLLSGVGVGMQRLCPRATDLPDEELTDIQVIIKSSFHI